MNSNKAKNVVAGHLSAINRKVRRNEDEDDESYLVKQNRW